MATVPMQCLHNNAQQDVGPNGIQSAQSNNAKGDGSSSSENGMDGPGVSQ